MVLATRFGNKLQDFPCTVCFRIPLSYLLSINVRVELQRVLLRRTKMNLVQRNLTPNLIQECLRGNVHGDRNHDGTTN